MLFHALRTPMVYNEKSIIFLSCCSSLIIYGYPLASFIFFLSFNSLIRICLGMNFFVFILFVIHWTYWICRFISSAKCGKFPTIISSNFCSHFVDLFYGRGRMKYLVHLVYHFICKPNLSFWLIFMWLYCLFWIRTCLIKFPPLHYLQYFYMLIFTSL